MNITGTASVLAKAAAYDRRTVGEADIMAWHEAIGDLDVVDALQAVAAHYRDSTDWLMPAHVRRIAADMDRGRRLAERQAAAEAERRPVAPPVTTDRSREVRDAVRAILPKGDPDKLRWGHKQWRELIRDEQRRREAIANPDFAGYPRAVEPSEVEGDAS
jgi:hypothetical protein